MDKTTGGQAGAVRHRESALRQEARQARPQGFPHSGLSRKRMTGARADAVSDRIGCRASLTAFWRRGILVGQPVSVLEQVPQIPRHTNASQAQTQTDTDTDTNIDKHLHTHTDLCQVPEPLDLPRCLQHRHRNKHRHRHTNTDTYLCQVPQAFDLPCRLLQLRVT
jgi:hypothetical protein